MHIIWVIIKGHTAIRSIANNASNTLFDVYNMDAYVCSIVVDNAVTCVTVGMKKGGGLMEGIWLKLYPHM